jgi:hypothetical protein
MKYAKELPMASFTSTRHFKAVLLTMRTNRRPQAQQNWWFIAGEKTKMYDELAALLFL